MKNIPLFILLAGLVWSCNQEPKGSAQVVESDMPLQEKTLDAAIDAVQASPANFKVLLENEQVRVLEYTLEPGEKDQWHTHPAKVSYVVSGGKVLVHRENGETIISEEPIGTASWMNAVGKHYVENTGKTTIKVILTEVKAVDESKN